MSSPNCDCCRLGLSCLLIVWTAGCGKEAVRRTTSAANDTDRESVYRQGMAHVDAHDYARAVTEFTQLLGSAPQSQATVKPVGVDEDVLYQRGLSYLGMGFPDIAIEDFNAVLKYRPDDADVYLQRGRAYQQMGDDRRAIQDCTHSIRLSADNPEAYRVRGVAYLARNEYQRAVANLERSKLQGGKAEDIDPLLSKAYVGRSQELKAAGETAQAQEMLAKAQELDPGFVPRPEPGAPSELHAKPVEEAKDHLKTGQDLAKQGDLESAHNEFTEAIALEPNLTDAYEKRAANWLARGFPDNALIDILSALRLGGYTSERYRLKARAQLGIGDNYGAADAASELMRRGPVDAEAFVIRGMAYLRREMFNEAIRDLSYAIEHDAQLNDRLRPVLAEAYYRRGKSLQEAGRVKEAQADFARAKELGWTDDSAADGR